MNKELDEMLMDEKNVSDLQYYLAVIKEDYKHFYKLIAENSKAAQREHRSVAKMTKKVEEELIKNRRDIRYLYNAIIKENHFDEMLEIIDDDLHDKLKFDLFNNFSLENRLVEVK